MSEDVDASLGDELDRALADLGEQLEQLAADRRADAFRVQARAVFRSEVLLKVGAESERAYLAELREILTKRRPTRAQSRRAALLTGHLAALVAVYRMQPNPELVPFIQAGARFKASQSEKAKRPRRGKLPPADELFQEFDSLLADGESESEAYRVLFGKYDASETAIRKKVKAGSRKT